MTVPKIDWTRPLRVVGTHERVTKVTIRPEWMEDGLPVYVEMGCARHCRVDQDGRHPRGFAVENIPPEPRIVERWCYVHLLTTGVWDFAYQHHLYVDRPKEDPHARIAKVLIEEHD